MNNKIKILFLRHGKTKSNIEKRYLGRIDEELCKDDEIEIGVQINGKVKVTITIPAGCSKEDAITKAKEALGDKLTGNIVKEIYVPGRIVNIVIK